jgi:hypothetical protein
MHAVWPNLLFFLVTKVFCSVLFGFMLVYWRGLRNPAFLCANKACLVLGRYDEHSHEQFVPGDPSKRAFTYFVLTGGRFIYASALRLAVLKFILSMTVRGAYWNISLHYSCEKSC